LTGVLSGRRTPNLDRLVGHAGLHEPQLAPVRIRPFITRTDDTTPRYWSKCESKMSACSGASASPVGRRNALDHRVEQLGDALTGLGEMRRISSAGMPRTCSISAA
jgi:hypothetical protein